MVLILLILALGKRIFNESFLTKVSAQPKECTPGFVQLVVLLGQGRFFLSGSKLFFREQNISDCV